LANFEPTTELTLFLSSTFADMIEERDILLRKTIPELSTRIQDIGARLQVIDLRWGIPDEQIRNGNLVSACLEAIEHSQLMIAIIGDRYGTIVHEFPKESWTVGRGSPIAKETASQKSR
jgi:hypothetical protein